MAATIPFVSFPEAGGDPPIAESNRRTGNSLSDRMVHPSTRRQNVRDRPRHRRPDGRGFTGQILKANQYN